MGMKVVNERCAGLDVHKKSVTACVRAPRDDGAKGRRGKVRTFGTTMADLSALRDWMESLGVTHVAMESTGVYWCSVWAALEGGFELLLVNPRHIKQVPGRKTDVKDSEWLARLLEAGLLRGSFVPDRAVRDLRDLTRTRKTVSRERTRHVNRVAKLLEQANVKLGSVVTDVMGKTGRAILDAMVAGETDSEKLAGLACGTLRSKRGELAEVVPGLMDDHRRFLVGLELRMIDYADRTLAELDARIEEAARLFAGGVALLESMPGVGARSARAIVAEIGDDMSKFPTAGHFASWARVCPGNHESAGKRRSTRTGKGNAWLREALSQASWAAVRTRDSYYRALYYRHRARGGPKRAIVAVQHAMLVAIWHMFQTGALHEDLGADHFRKRNKMRAVRRHISRLQKLGVEIEIVATAA